MQLRTVICVNGYGDPGELFSRLLFARNRTRLKLLESAKGSMYHAVLFSYSTQVTIRNETAEESIVHPRGQRAITSYERGSKEL
jgi:hypothetical protein